MLRVPQHTTYTDMDFRDRALAHAARHPAPATLPALAHFDPKSQQAVALPAYAKVLFRAPGRRTLTLAQFMDEQKPPPQDWFKDTKEIQRLQRSERTTMQTKLGAFQRHEADRGVLCMHGQFAGPRYQIEFTTYLAPHHAKTWTALHAGTHKLPILVHLHGGGFMIGTKEFNHGA